jgi:hypothetical protein
MLPKAIMFTELFNTFVFSTISAFFQTLWSDPAGRIFLITFLAYSTSYMLYSGYMSWFAGGYGSLLLSQYGFTAIDFLSLVPTAFVFFAQAAFSLTKFLARFLSVYILGPIFLLLIIVSFKEHYGVIIFSDAYWLASIGFLLWLVGALSRITPFPKKEMSPRTSILISYFGVALIILALPLPEIVNQPDESIPVSSSSPSIIVEIIVPLFLGMLLVTPFLIGRSMAETATREKLLSRVMKLALSQAISIPGAVPTPEEDTALRKVFSKPGLYYYVFDEHNPIYLVSSFSQTTILYAPTETTGDERGRLILVANSLLCSLEINGARLNK